MCANSESAPERMELIKRYRLAQHKRAVARRCITLLAVGVVVVCACLLWAAIRDFRYNRVPEFTGALNAEATMILPNFLSDVAAAANRLYPHYTATFQHMFERDYPKMRDAVSVEMTAIDRYAGEKRPEIENALIDIMLSTEDMVVEDVNKFSAA